MRDRALRAGGAVCFGIEGEEREGPSAGKAMGPPGPAAKAGHEDETVSLD